MKDKAPLLLMEQLIMRLVFALTAAICLRGFAYASQFSRDIRQREQAVLLAQSAAEELKVSRQTDSTCYYDEMLEAVDAQEDWCFRVVVQSQTSGISGLGQAQIRVDSTDTENLFTLTVGWQEE